MRRTSVIANDQRKRGNPRRWIASLASLSRNDGGLWVFLVLLFFASQALAFDYEPPLPDAAQEKTAQEIFSEIRCLVCDGESLTDSSADYSVAMRALIREQIASGKDKKQVVEYLTDRFGVGILQSPPKRGGALLLWFTPVLLIIFGIYAIRRRKK